MIRIKKQIADVMAQVPVLPAIYDLAGLVDTYVNQAERWIVHYIDAQQLTPLEAFEGIGHLGKLTRCDPRLLQESEGGPVLANLREICTGEQKELLLDLAFRAPVISVWLEDARALGEAVLTTLESTADQAARLVEDLDALDFLLWWSEESASICPSQLIWKQHNLQAISELVNQCSAWLASNPSVVLESESQLRAIAETIRDDVEDCETTGLLALSAVKYVTLLSEFGRMAHEERATVQLPFLPHRPIPIPGPNPVGGPLPWLDRDFWSVAIPVATYQAAKTRRTLTFGSYPEFTDPAGLYVATLHIPDELRPSQRTVVMISIKLARHLAGDVSLVDLKNADLRFGGSCGKVVVVLDDQLRATHAEVELIVEDIASTGEEYIYLQVGEHVWRPLQEESG